MIVIESCEIIPLLHIFSYIKSQYYIFEGRHLLVSVYIHFLILTKKCRIKKVQRTIFILRKKFPRICIRIEAYLSATQITKLAPTCHYSLSPCRNPYVSRISCMGANTLSVTRARARTHLPVHLSGTHPAVA